MRGCQIFKFRFDVKKVRLLKSKVNFWKVVGLYLLNNCLINIAQVAKLFSYSWTMGFISCKMLYYMQSVSGICSVLNLTALSIER